MSKKRKNFVIDTSVLVYHEDAIHAFSDNNLYIPITVLEELDRLKVRNDKVGNSARYVNRFLDNLRSKGKLSSGVLLDNGQKIFVITDYDLKLLPKFFEENNDNKIISCALELSHKRKNVVFISRDIAQRIKCDSLGVQSEDYVKEKATVRRRGAYTGVSVIEFDKDDVTEFYEEGEIYSDEELMPNEFVVLKGGQSSGLGIFKNDRIEKLKYSGGKDFSIEKVFPRNKEQVFAMEMLLDQSIHMVTITGMAGSGKTLLACAAAISQLFNKKYDRIVISRPVRSMSADIGFLPGTKEEKMKSWVQPFFDNFNHIFPNGKAYLEGWIGDGTIEIEALSFIRGRTLPNTIFILDEAQNINYHEAKAVLTRMGDNSKIILLGDLEQIDAPHLDASTSGLNSIVELFKDFELAGHITLLKGERSPLATHAAKIL